MKQWRWMIIGMLALGVLVGGSERAEAQGASDELPTLDEELDQFWAERRRVRVVQRRLFEKDGRFYASLSMGIVPNDPYVTYFPVGLRLGYYLNEDIGFELSGNWTGNTLRSTSDIGDRFLATGERFFPRDQQQWRTNAVVSWSPSYGKFSLLGRKIAHFDWNFVAGFGILMAEGPEEDNLNVISTSLFPEAVLGSGINWWLTNRWALRFDYRQMIFQKSSGGVALPSELSIGGTFFF